VASFRPRCRWGLHSWRLFVDERRPSIISATDASARARESDGDDFDDDDDFDGCDDDDVECEWSEDIDDAKANDEDERARTTTRASEDERDREDDDGDDGEDDGEDERIDHTTRGERECFEIDRRRRRHGDDDVHEWGEGERGSGRAHAGEFRERGRERARWGVRGVLCPVVSVLQEIGTDME